MVPCIHRLDRRLKTVTKSKMIVVWGDENVLGSSVKYFLSTKEDWTVVSVSTKAELDALIREMDPIHLDVVIIHQGCQGDPANLPLQFLRDHPAIQVITISLENNLMDVYSKQKIMIRQASDLITVIEGGEKQSKKPDESINHQPSIL
jgi:hypothetical protein